MRKTVPLLSRIVVGSQKTILLTLCLSLLSARSNASQPIFAPTCVLSFNENYLTLQQDSLFDPDSLIAQAVAGAYRRGEQGNMLRVEAEVPGFGGFFLDSLDQLVIVMKVPSDTSSAHIRQVIQKVYAGRKERRIREVMDHISSARVVLGQFTLSELLSFENRISHSSIGIPGYVGVGTSIKRNRVVLGFDNSANVSAGMRVARSLGVPASALISEVWGPVSLSSDFAPTPHNHTSPR
jgi:hypothetical protein